MQNLSPTIARCVCGVLPEHGLSLDSHLQHLERSLIEQALERSAGNRAEAARLLGLNRTTLVERLKRFGRPECA